ncbi:hypothetical protein JCM8547_005585 [Rhodosporidiobolus lusitaniae]
MRLAWADPQATSLSGRRYRSKLCLLYLLWAYSPSFPTSSKSAASTSSATNSTLAVSSSSSSSLPASSSGAGEQVVIAHGGGTPPGVTNGEIGETGTEASAQKSPFTAPFNPVEPSPLAMVPSQDVQGGGTTAQAVQGATSGNGATRPPEKVGKTPRLSPALSPSFFSSHPEPSSSSAPPPSTDEGPPHRILLTPLRLTLLILHSLFLLQAGLAHLGSSLSAKLILSPIPPAFSEGTKDGMTSAPMSREKKWTCWKWRAKTVWTACGWELVRLAAVGAVLLGGLATEAFTAGVGAKGWNPVPLAGLFGGGEEGGRLILAQGFASTSEATRKIGKVGGPWYWVVGIELLFTLYNLVTSLSPIYLSLYPSRRSLPLPKFLTLTPLSSSPCPSQPKLLIPLPVLLPPLLALTTHFSTLMQVLFVFLSRYPDPAYPVWRRWLSFSTLVLINAILAPLEGVLDVREKAMGEVERVGEVVRVFGMKPEEGAKAKEEDEEGWTCSVCFEGGRREEEERERSMGCAGWWTRCRLPCNHVFHSSCLALWFSNQAFCPTCHRDARLPPTSSPSSATTTSSPFSSGPFLLVTPNEGSAPGFLTPDDPRLIQLPLVVPPEPRVDTSVFPGAAAAARRRRRRETGVAAERSEEEVGWETE